MTAIVKFEGANLHDGEVVVDLVFIRQGLSDEAAGSSGVKPWKNFHKTELWTKDWLLDEFEFPCRVFDASYYPTTECWQERFPLLECSKIILHQLTKQRVGALNHITFFFAWSLDALFLKQILHTALLDSLEVSLALHLLLPSSLAPFPLVPLCLLPSLQWVPYGDVPAIR
jgi:hypothetical protein